MKPRRSFGAKKPKLDSQVGHVANIFRWAKDLSPAFVELTARQYRLKLTTARGMADREIERRAGNG